MHLICANFSQEGTTHRANAAPNYPLPPTPLEIYQERVQRNFTPQGKSETASSVYTQFFSNNVICLCGDTYSITENYLLLT